MTRQDKPVKFYHIRDEVAGMYAWRVIADFRKDTERESMYNAGPYRFYVVEQKTQIQVTMQ